MIRYRLSCNKRHEFEAWFANSTAFERQAKRGQLACPACGSKKVSKTLMAPSIAKRGKAKRVRTGTGAKPSDETAQPDTSPDAGRFVAHRELAEAMRKLRAEVQAKSEYVGPRFPEEARKIHYEEVPARGIYGEATTDEAKALNEEGIEFYPLPLLPEDHN
jgi:hypothetical protein